MHGEELMRTKNKPTALMIATIALLGIVIYAGNVMTIDTSKITDIICLASFTLMPISGIVCAICFLIPLHSGITGLYIYGYAVLMILLKSKKFKLKVFIPLLVIVVYEMIMMVFAGVSQINYIIVYALTVFLLLYMMNTDEVDAKAASISYVAGAVALLVCIFTTAIQNYSLEMVLAGVVRIGDYEGIEDIGQVAVVTENANAMAYYALVAIFIAFHVMKSMKTLGKIVMAASMLLLTVISLFTVSRTFIIVLLVLFLLVCLSGFNFKQKLKFLFVLAIVLGIVIPYLQEQTQIFDAFLMRFEEDNIASGSGRTKIFSIYMKYLWNNPVRLMFGTGAVFYQKVCNLGYSMHNGTQQILVSYGVLGFLPMLGILISPIRAFLKKNKFKLTKFLPIFAVAMFAQSIQFLNPNNLMLPYAIAILCMKIPDAEDAK